MQCFPTSMAGKYRDCDPCLPLLCKQVPFLGCPHRGLAADYGSNMLARLAAGTLPSLSRARPYTINFKVTTRNGDVHASHRFHSLYAHITTSGQMVRNPKSETRCPHSTTKLCSSLPQACIFNPRSEHPPATHLNTQLTHQHACRHTGNNMDSHFDTLCQTIYRDR